MTGPQPGAPVDDVGGDPVLEPADPKRSGRWVPIAVIVAIALIVGVLLWNRSRAEEADPSATGTTSATATATPTASASQTPEESETPDAEAETPGASDAPNDAQDQAAASPPPAHGPAGEGSAFDNPLAYGAPTGARAAEGGLTITLGAPEDGAGRVDAGGGDYAGAQFMLLPVTVAYQGSGTFDAWAGVTVSYQPPGADYVIEQVDASVADSLESREPLRGGESTTGYLVFPFPPDMPRDGRWLVETSGGDPVYVGAR